MPTGKKGKKSKGKSLSLGEFLGNSSVDGCALVVNQKTSWADETEDDFQFGTKSIELSTSSRQSKLVDLDRVPTKPPYIAYVANLPFDVEDQDIKKFFHGLEILKIRLPREGGEFGRFKGFGYVEFETSEDLVEGLSYNESVMGGRKIRVDVAEEDKSGGRREGQQKRSDFVREERSEDISDWRAAPRSSDKDVSPARDGFDDRDRGSGDRNRSYGDRDRGFGDRDRDRGFGDRDRGFGDRDRGFGDRDRDRGYGNRDRGYEDRNRDRGYGDRDRGYGDRDRGFGDRDRGYGDRDRGYGDRDKGRDRGYGNRDRGYGDRDRRYNDRGTRDRSSSRESFDKDDRGGHYDDRRSGGGRYRRDGDRWKSRGGGDRGENEPVKERPRLNLKPRSKPAEEANESAANASSTTTSSANSSSAIFGGAKPVDTTQKEFEIEKKLVDNKETPVKKDAPQNPSREDIFGSAKPVDTFTREKEIEEKLRKQDSSSKKDENGQTTNSKRSPLKLEKRQSSNRDNANKGGRGKNRESGEDDRQQNRKNNLDRENVEYRNRKNSTEGNVSKDEKDANQYKKAPKMKKVKDEPAVIDTANKFSQLGLDEEEA